MGRNKKENEKRGESRRKKKKINSDSTSTPDVKNEKNIPKTNCSKSRKLSSVDEVGSEMTSENYRKLGSKKFKNSQVPIEGVGNCPMGYFGVKSYLHQFYESLSQSTTAPQTPQVDDEFEYLIHPKVPPCRRLIFKIGLITGSILLLLGAISILIGYSIPPQQPIRGETPEFKIVDREALRFNHNLDMIKLLGLSAFCAGGLLLVGSLLGPTFTKEYWEEEGESFKIFNNEESGVLLPVSKKLENIQPVWVEDRKSDPGEK